MWIFWILRQLLLLAVAGLASWWLFLMLRPLRPTPRQPVRIPIEIAVLPMLEQEEPPAEPVVAQPVPEPVAEPEPEPQPEQVEQPEEEAPPPPELGTPDGAEDAPPQETLADEAEPDLEEVVAARAPAQELMRDEELLQAAEAELSGESRKGFSTAFFSSPEEQLAIARYFGEEIVIIPWMALGDEPYFRLDAYGRVEEVAGPFPIADYRQYRDLFEYEYGRLSSPIKELRQRVLSRKNVYRFAALIPTREWAVVIARRDAALAVAGRSIDEVRTFELKYERQPDGGYDVQVEKIIFEDGTRFQPSSLPKGY